MKLAYVTAAAVIFMSTPSFAEAPSNSVLVPNYYSSFSLFSDTTILSVLTSGYYTFSLNTDINGSTTLASLTTDIFAPAASTAFASVGGGVNTDTTKSTGQYYLTALTDYTVKWSGFSLGGTTTGTLTANAVTAVPGPDAGAGLGALAMCGLAYWAKRRRDEKSAA